MLLALKTFGFKIQAEDPNADDKLVFAFQLTRHGARGPYLYLDEPIIYTQPWKAGLGFLTPTGERQHYLLGRKHRMKLIDDNQLLSETFNPNEIFIMSTDVNRTIMSAYSEINAWYPMGTVQKLDGDERDHALPPFEIPDKLKILAELGDFPTKEGFQPMPIHVGQEINEMLRAMDAATCPVVTKFEKLARLEDSFRKVNERYKDNILKQLRENWGILRDLDIISSKVYSDNFYSNYFDVNLLEERFMFNMTYVDTLLADQFYFYTFYFDEMVRIASSKFLNYIHTTIDAKIKSIATGEDDGTGIKDRKLIFFSAHDSTLAAMLSGIEKKQELQPFFASHILIELWQKSGTSGKEADDYIVKWIYNDEALNVNGTCDKDGRCPYPQFKEFLQFREYKGNWHAACQGNEILPAYTGAWYVVVGAAAGALGLGMVSYFVIKKYFFMPKDL